MGVLAALWLLAAFPARAQLAGTDTAAGSSCAGLPAGAARITADGDGDGRNIALVCDGSIWGYAGTGAGGRSVGFQAGCTSTDSGTIRYASAAPSSWEYCDGTTWEAFKQPRCQNDSTAGCYLQTARAGDDADFTGENILKDKTILGITGTFTGCVPPPLCPTVGDICDDGNPATASDPIFAAFVQYGTAHVCQPVFITQANQGAAYWRNTGGSVLSPNSLWDGRVNSNQIPNSTSYPAFKLCKDLTDGGFTDWYLPSRGEALMIFLNEDAINASATQILSGEYWTSTEDTTGNNAWDMGYGGGALYRNNKTIWHYVRCVRR